MLKKCINCGQELPMTSEYFREDDSCKDGFISKCRQCLSEYNRQYFLDHKNKITEYQKKYRERNKTEAIEYHKNWYQEHKTERYEYQKEYNRNNKDKTSVYNKRQREKAKRMEI